MRTKNKAQFPMVLPNNLPPTYHTRQLLDRGSDSNFVPFESSPTRPPRLIRILPFKLATIRKIPRPAQSLVMRDIRKRLQRE